MDVKKIKWLKNINLRNLLYKLQDAPEYEGCSLYLPVLVDFSDGTQAILVIDSYEYADDKHYSLTVLSEFNVYKTDYQTTIFPEISCSSIRDLVKKNLITGQFTLDQLKALKTLHDKESNVSEDFVESWRDYVDTMNNDDHGLKAYWIACAEDMQTKADEIYEQKLQALKDWEEDYQAKIDNFKAYHSIGNFDIYSDPHQPE